MIARLVRLIAYASIGGAFVELVRSAQALLEYDRENTAEFLAKLEPVDVDEPPAKRPMVGQCPDFLAAYTTLAGELPAPCSRCGYEREHPAHEEWRDALAP